MATQTLQAQTTAANAGGLSLYSASVTLEYIGQDLENLSALVHLAQQADGLGESMAAALRAITSRLDDMAEGASRQSDLYLEASKSRRASAG